MRQNVLKFQSDIKVEVAKIKENKGSWWMHPAYCAYYIIKHKVNNPEEYINKDIERSYKALGSDWLKASFKDLVNKYLDEYAEVVCIN